MLDTQSLQRVRATLLLLCCLHNDEVKEFTPKEIKTVNSTLGKILSLCAALDMLARAARERYESKQVYYPLPEEIVELEIVPWERE